MGRAVALMFTLATGVLLANGQDAGERPPALPGASLIETRHFAKPLELKAATADEEAVIAGQKYVQYTYQQPTTLTAVVFVQSIRDKLFASGWKLLDVTKLEEIPLQPETVNVAAHYRINAHNVYVRFTQEPDRPYTVNVADIDTEDWSAQLADECRIRIYSIHFAKDRPIIDEVASEPTLRKLATLLTSEKAPAVRIEGHMDNIGEAGVAARDTLALGRARMVMSWLTTTGGVPANKVSAEGRGKSRPIVDNDTDLGRALNRRIEVARGDCPR